MEIPYPGFNEGRDLGPARPRSTDPREAILDCFGRGLDALSREEIERLRRRITAYFGAENLFVDVIDGHLALRDVFAVGL